MTVVLTHFAPSTQQRLCDFTQNEKRKADGDESSRGKLIHQHRFGVQMIAQMNLFRGQMIDHRKQFDGQMIDHRKQFGGQMIDHRKVLTGR